MSNIKNQLNQDIKQALKTKDIDKLRTLRFISAAFKQFEVDSREDVTDEKIIDILDKLTKQHKDSIQQFQKAKREDLVQQEQNQLSITMEYLPKQLSNEEVNSAISAAIQSTSAASIKDMGKVMGVLKGNIKGQADFSAVSKLVKNMLSS